LDQADGRRGLVVRGELEGWLPVWLRAMRPGGVRLLLREMVEADNAQVIRNALARQPTVFTKSESIWRRITGFSYSSSILCTVPWRMATTSLAVQGRGEIIQQRHDRIVSAIEARDGDAADAALRAHIWSLFF
jgi:hypothetical protein